MDLLEVVFVSGIVVGGSMGLSAGWLAAGINTDKQAVSPEAEEALSER